MKKKCEQFLLNNGYCQVYSAKTKENFDTFVPKNTNISGVDISDEEIVFVGDNGDWLHLPCNLYALIGALIHFRQIGVGYKYE